MLLERGLFLKLFLMMTYSGLIKAQRFRVTKGQRDKETKVQSNKGSKGQRLLGKLKTH